METEKPRGYYGVDIKETETVDLVQDLDQENWDLPSNHFEVIRAIDVFEHIGNPTSFMEEVWRIAVPESEVIIRGPHFSSGNWHDPTHARLLGSRTFEHFSQDSRFGFYSDCSFEIKHVEIQFQWQNTPLDQLGHFLANKYTEKYETTFLRNILPATNIEFKLQPIKSD